MAEQLGPLLRLRGLTSAQLPDPSARPEELAPFLVALLQEAVPFIDSAAPKTAGLASAPVPNSASLSSSSSPTPPGTSGTPRQQRQQRHPLWKHIGTKKYADSSAPVELLERVIPAADLPPPPPPHAGGGREPQPRPRDETWVCRRSVHADAASRGTASWAEFRARLMGAAHGATEEAMTPTVAGRRTALTWGVCNGNGNGNGDGDENAGALLPPPSSAALEGGEAWGRFGLRVDEVRHRVGRPLLRDRVFAVLQMACAAQARPGDGGRDGARGWGDGDGDGDGDGAADEKAEFLVVSVTVADFAARPEARLCRAGDVVLGSYVSVERIRRLPPGDEGGDGGGIEWLMATASDARGVLPPWVQVLAVPGQIAKDVPLFLAWIQREREKEEGASAVAGAKKSVPLERVAEGEGGHGGGQGGGRKTERGSDPDAGAR